MADQEPKRDSSARVQITVALIGLAGVVATALIANWSNIFHGHQSPTAPVPAQPGPPGSGNSKKSERPVHSSGALVVRGTFSCDLDAGVETNAGADFWWEIRDHVQRDLVPRNGAAFFVVGQREFESIRWSEMERFAYSRDKISAPNNNSNRIPAGTVVAYKTNEGRLGKFIVDEYGDSLKIRWRTYD